MCGRQLVALCKSGSLGKGLPMQDTLDLGLSGCPRTRAADLHPWTFKRRIFLEMPPAAQAGVAVAVCLGRSPQETVARAMLMPGRLGLSGMYRLLLDNVRPPNPTVNPTVPPWPRCTSWGTAPCVLWWAYKMVEGHVHAPPSAPASAKHANLEEACVTKGTA